jgi:hypothetical protein
MDNFVIRHGTFDHLVDERRSHRSRFMTTNRSTDSMSNYCPECRRERGRLTVLTFYKDQSVYECSVCFYRRQVDSITRKAIVGTEPGTFSAPGIPTLDGLTDQTANQPRKVFMRGISGGDLRSRSQYSSHNRFGRDGTGVHIPRETRAQAEAMNASIVNYSEILPKSEKGTVSSKELRQQQQE